MAKQKGMTRAEHDLLKAHIGRDISVRDFESEEAAEKYFEVTYMGKTYEEVFKDITRQEKAKDLAFLAAGLSGSRNIINFAQKALRVDSNCAPAYLLIADEVKGMASKKKYFIKAAEAAKKTLGDSFNDGTIGNTFDTTPYLTAQTSLSDILWIEKDYNGSIAILNELLNLNPGDPAGIHFSLLSRLLLFERFLEADRIIEKYDDEKTAFILFSKAYIAFHKNSKIHSAAHTLKEAMLFNPYVPMFLLGFAELPDYDEDDERSFSFPGNPAEADDYLVESEALWFKDNKVITWFIAEFARNKSDIIKLIEERGELEEWDDPNADELNELEEAMTLRNYGELEEILRNIDPDKLDAILSDPDMDWDDDDDDFFENEDDYDNKDDDPDESLNHDSTD
jgi:hypothetical protein